MNQEVKTKWIVALRSGEYNQTTRRLRRSDNKFCCLGVLCDLYIKETGKGGWLKDDAFLDSKGVKSSSSHTTEVNEWAGMIDRVYYNGNDRWLDGVNDDGASFIEIANIIEEQL